MIAGLVACLVLAAVAAEGRSTETIFHVPPVRFERDGCTSGLYRGTYVSPFAVLVSCEDALGNYLSVVYSGTMGAPADGAWQIGVREWHESEWGDDVTSYTWGAEGQRLYVATSGVYGSGSVYALDLREKKSRRLLPTGAAQDSDEVIFEIRGLDEVKHLLTVAHRSGDEKSWHSEVVRLVEDSPTRGAKP